MRTYLERSANVEVIPTGSLALNDALGIGGYPKGHIIELFGWDSSGKTTLALHAIAECQKQGGTAVFIDVENTFDCNYAQNLGVNINELYVIRPEDEEKALAAALRLIRSSVVNILVIDSVAAMVSQFEKLEPIESNSNYFLYTTFMDYAVNRILESIGNAVCIFINQIRMKPDKDTGRFYETTPGGYALKDFSTMRLKINRNGIIKDGDTAVGNQVSVDVIKNNMGVPYRKAEFEITFGKGISHTGEIVDLGLSTGVIKKIGSWLIYNDNRLGRCRYLVKKLLNRNPELAEEIAAKIVEKLKNNNGYITRY